MATKMERITSPHVPEPEPGLWSNCKRLGDHVYVSGQVAMDAEGRFVGGNDPFAQAMCAFTHIKHLLEAAGGAMDDIIKLNIYLTDIRHRPAVLAARRKFFSGDFPCATLVAVAALFDPRALVEIDAEAFIGAGGA